MNEFTKEELELINKCIWLADTEHGLCRVFEVHKLQIKVQSLIDNYCEHETEMDRKNKIYRERILPRFGNDPDKVPPYMEPDYNEGWR